MIQAQITDGSFSDPPPFCPDFATSPEIGICRRQVTETLVKPMVIKMIDKGVDRFFELAMKVEVLSRIRFFSL